jgi:hypothetical protein
MDLILESFPFLKAIQHHSENNKKFVFIFYHKVVVKQAPFCDAAETKSTVM